MKRLLLAALLFLAGFAPLHPLLAAPVDISGARFEEKVRVGQADLQLNGAGLRTRFFLNVYAIGLYLGGPKKTAADALSAPGFKRIHIQLLRDLTAAQFVDALVESFHNNNDGAETGPFKTRLDELKSTMMAINAAKKGDVIHIDWLPDQGTRITLNGRPLGKELAGEDFYRALMKIWLGPKAVQESVKEALLGKSQ